MEGFQVQIVKESTTALADAFNFARAHGKGRGLSIDVEIFPVVQWVEVTHATKKAIMAAIAPADLRKVGCENPDVWHKKDDDLIVLTRPKSMGKGKAHTTDVHAANVFGHDWKKKLNAHKFTTSKKTQFVMEQFPKQFSKAKPFGPGDAVAFIKIEPKSWLAVVLRATRVGKQGF